MKIYLCCFFFAIQVFTGFTQTEGEYADVELDLTEEEEIKRYSKMFPLSSLTYIDTLRRNPGLYRATIGENEGYPTYSHRYGIFNDQDLVIPFLYSFLPREYSDFIIAKKFMVGTGVIDSLNNEVIPFIYQYIIPVNKSIPARENKYFLAKKEGKVGLIDKTGKEIIPIQYKKTYPKNSNFFTLEDLDGKFGLARLSNNLITSCSYTDHLDPMDDEVIKTANKEITNRSVNRTFGWMDTLGNEIIPAIYKSLELSLDSNYLIAYDGVHSKIYSKKGDIVFQLGSTKIENLVTGSYKTNDRKGKVIRNDFKEVFVPNYRCQRLPSSSLYQTRKGIRINDRRGGGPSGGLTGIRNYLEEEILPIAFSRIVLVHEDLIYAQPEGNPLYAAYNRQGKEIMPPTYSYMQTSTNRKFIIVSHPETDKYALLDSSATELTPFVYNDLMFGLINTPSGKKIKIEARKGKDLIRLSEKGEEIERLTKNEFRYNVQSKNAALDVKVTNLLSGNYYRYFSTDKYQFLVQYIFTEKEKGKGKKIMFITDENGKEYRVDQTLTGRVENMGTTYTPQLWLFLEKPSPFGKVPKSILKLLEKESFFPEKENFRIKAKYPDYQPSSTALAPSPVDYQSADLENKKIITTLFQIVDTLNKSIIYKPFYEEKPPTIFVDLKTKECFFSHYKALVKKFSRIEIKDNSWYLISTKEAFNPEKHLPPYVVLSNVNHLNSDDQIIKGDLSTVHVDYNYTYYLRYE